ncbi:unnamed protein product [Closterium sp. Yama58-4]|nr:unnamed protein product [Closterium sp. Yama58-4]
MESSPTPSDPSLFDTLSDDLMILIFQRLASNSVSFSHAVVCSRWLRLARVSQSAVHVARRREISGAQLIRAVSRMPNLTSLDLSNRSVDSITDAFLAGLANACPQLSSLSLTAGGHGTPLSHSSLGLEALFSTCTRLQQLRLHGTAAGVTALPSPLLHLQQLKTFHLSMDHLQELPPAFGLLSSLTHLNLHTPLLKFLPPTLGKLSNLEYFELVDCDSLVSLPECIGQLSRLSDLSVSSSSLVLLPDSISLLSLTSLDLILPALSLLPASLGHSSLSTSLSLLALTICTTLHSLPASLPSLHMLKTIEISQCSLSALPDDFGFLPSLQKLELNACEELSHLPDSFSLLPSLANLSITGCPSLLSLPENFGQLSCLKSFELCSVAKVTCLPVSFGQLEALQELKISDCPALQELPSSLGKICSLECIAISRCGLLNSLPSSIVMLPRLQELTIRRCSSLQSLPDSFSALSLLKSLVIEDCKGITFLPVGLGQMPNLQMLKVVGCAESYILYRQLLGLYLENENLFNGEGHDLGRTDSGIVW